MMAAKLKIYSQTKWCFSSNIADLLVDHNGRIWIATFGGGLNFNTKSQQKIIYDLQNIDNDASPFLPI
jgi:ligand-binding sensor domain-containing protein